MAPANQGSKAALITWTVIATVFGITMAVLALIAYVGKSDIQARYDNRQTEFNEFASDADLQNTAMSELRAKVKEENQGNVYGLLVSRQDNLSRLATGATRYEQAEESIKATITQVNAAAGLSASTLTGAIEQLQAQLAAVKRENETLRGSQEQLQARLESDQQNYQQTLDDKDQAIKDLQNELNETQALYQQLVERTQAIETGSAESVASLRVEWEDKLREAEDRITQLTRALEAADRRVKILTDENAKRWNFDQMMASSDGNVLRSPSQGRLYINLGRNQGISNGMTFQVYDPVIGIPKVESQEATNLPTGKGSIQVIRVEHDSAEARIVHQEPGQNIREGDLIANLAYDKNVPVRFRIYGSFDLDNDGNPSPTDRDRLMTLVREFRGRIVDDVTVETDVLIMGQEPEVPRVTEADLADPMKNQEYQRAVQQRDEYMAVRKQAQDLNVPILNQNQFLYYIGYFDQVNR